MMIDLTKIPFIKAKAYKKVENREPQFIILSCAEAKENALSAEDAAKRYQTGSSSVHYCVDADSVVQCVNTEDAVVSAPGISALGIFVELAGFSKQSPKEWRDDFSIEVIKNAARLCAMVICPKYNVPFRLLTTEELAIVNTDSTVRGFCTRAQGTHAFKIQEGILSPGKDFPMRLFVEFVKLYGAK